MHRHGQDSSNSLNLNSHHQITDVRHRLVGMHHLHLRREEPMAHHPATSKAHTDHLPVTGRLRHNLCHSRGLIQHLPAMAPTHHLHHRVIAIVDVAGAMDQAAGLVATMAAAGSRADASHGVETAHGTSWKWMTQKVL